MKGLLKGLKFMSQMFENEKEPEMQIGLPTDVKHVAHIGLDGPSVNSPSWMTEFKAPPPSSAPNGDIKAPNGDASVQWASQESKRDMAVTTRDLPELPKSSRRQSSTVGESTGKEKSEKVRSKKSSKSKESTTSNGVRASRRSADLNQGGESPTQAAPGIPKKARRKRSKEDGSTRSKSKATATESCSSQFSDNGSDAGSIAGSISRSNDEDLLTGDVFT
ncbi:CRIB domain-containing protein RIC7-like [Cucurbita maxima]|uniref:CRIB domain-containing protein RIC7-like n=1 Tax=Cucurbita maxima TaxID=3661 RepID=A0A6J1HR56_CUCMA|nr:CRIB domain-containing protein RIC7-like [Cucurbita maxima]